VDTLALVLHNDAMLLAHELTSLQLSWRRILSNDPPCAFPSVVSSPPPPPPPTSCQLADLAWHARTVAMRYVILLYYTYFVCIIIILHTPIISILVMLTCIIILCYKVFILYGSWKHVLLLYYMGDGNTYYYYTIWVMETCIIIIITVLVM